MRDGLDDRPFVVDEPSDFTAYLQEIAGGFCPFLRPSMKSGTIYASEYDAKTIAGFSDNGDLAEGLYYACLRHTEWLRVKRLALAAPASLLLCDNVILRGDIGASSESLRRLLSWPHWILKCQYAPVAVMFGKFWRGEEERTEDGRYIPQPPVTFVSIRSAVKPNDIRFLANKPELQALVMDGVDSLQSVHPADVDPLDTHALAAHHYYHSAKAWAEQRRDALRDPLDKAGNSNQSEQ